MEPEPARLGLDFSCRPSVGGKEGGAISLPGVGTIRMLLALAEEGARLREIMDGEGGGIPVSATFVLTCRAAAGRWLK